MSKAEVGRGRAVEIVSRLHKWSCKRFRVSRDGLGGCCYSFCDHFEIHWDDGTHEPWRAELSTDGTRKAGAE